MLNKGQNNLPLETHQKKTDNIEIIEATPGTDQDYLSVKKEQPGLKTERDADASMANESIKIELKPLENKLRMQVENYFHFLP